MKWKPEGVPGVGRLVPAPALVPCAVPRPARAVQRGAATSAAGKPGDGPVAELVPRLEVDEEAGKEDAVGGAGLEPERVGGEVGKVPEPGAGVVISGAPPVMPVRRWAAGVGVTSGAAWDAAATPPKGGLASVPTKWAGGPFGLAVANAAASSARRCSSISRSMRLSRAWA